jgi:hypothetical protein
LRDILAGITSPFYCTGRTVLGSAPGIKFQDNTLFSIVPTASTANAEASLKPLLDRLSPAPFGEGSVTKFDPNVRNALQLKAEGNVFTVVNFDPATSGILAEVCKKLLLPASPTNNLVAELYALNAYCKDGHFRFHKVPRSRTPLA